MTLYMQSDAALSYYWGGEQKMKTTTEIKPYRTKIEFDRPPATIKDAIKVTYHLDLTYLWIDAFCIVQDDNDDKARDVTSIAYIYQGAEVTIAVSRAQSVDEGFLGNLTRYGQEYPEKVFRLRYEDFGSSAQRI